MHPYQPFEGTYRVPVTGTPGSRWRVARLALVALFVLLLAGLVFRVVEVVFTGTPAELGWTLLSPGNVVLLLAGLYLARPPMTRLAAAGITSREQPLRTRSATWSEVTAVQPPGRFEDHPVAVLVSGARIPLPGLPKDVAARMAAVTALEPEPPAHPTSRPSYVLPEPADDDDLDGPFRRG